MFQSNILSNGSYLKTQGAALLTGAVIALSSIQPASAGGITANPDNAASNEGETIYIDVLENDQDLGRKSVSISVITPPANGTAWVNSSNQVVYQSDPGFNGTDTLVYKVRRNKKNSDTAVVTVQVAGATDPVPENSVPVAMADSATLDAGTAQTIDVLANDDGLLDGPINIDLPILPANGQVQVNTDNTVTYTAFSDYEGSDDFTYRITDADGETATAMVSLNVQCPLCVKDTNVTLSWDPNLENVSGYWIVYGDTPEGATTYLSDLVTESGDFNPSAPAVIYSAATDLGANPGDQVCFRVGARLDLLESSLSEAVCAIL